MKKMFVPSLIALALVSISGFAQAQTTEPASSLSFNVGATTDYRYRGISQSRLQPALQGGIDYADKSGFYVGAWGSTIKWVKDSGASKGTTEVDLYAGYKGAAGDLSYDVGVLRYQYLGNTLGAVANYANANTTEVYGALTYKVFTAKYSHALTNTFGNVDSKNSYYLDLSATLDMGNGFTLTPHVGRQMINNTPLATYTDYSFTLSKDLGNGLSASVMAVGTNANSGPYTLAGKYNGNDALVVGLKYAF